MFQSKADRQDVFIINIIRRSSKQHKERASNLQRRKRVYDTRRDVYFSKFLTLDYLYQNKPGWNCSTKRHA